MLGFDENNSDSDDNDGNNDPYDGYQQLNSEGVPDDNDDGDEDNTIAQEAAIKNQNPTADAEIACQVWNAPRPKVLDIKIDSTKCDEIKSVMSKVQLGGIDAPEWSKHIPERKWIEELLLEVRKNKSLANHNTNQISSDAPSSSK